MKIIGQTDSLFIIQEGRMGATILFVVLIILFGYLILRLTDFFQKPDFWKTIGFWLPLVFVIGSSIMILISVTFTITFDKNGGIMSMSRKGIISDKVQEYQTDKIEKIILQEFWGISTLSVGLKNGEELFLHRQRSGVFWGGKKFHGFGLFKVADGLSKFLNLPLDYSYPGRKN